MNLCDYYVHEVLGQPTFRKHLDFTWWEIKVSYYYDNGKLVTRTLDFDSEEEANRVTKGFHFLA